MTSPDASGRTFAAPDPPPPATTPEPPPATGPTTGPTTDLPPPPGTRPGDKELLAAKLVPLRHPGQWISALVLLVLFAMLVHTVLTNSRFQWGTVGDYFLNASILHGLELTLWLTGAVMATGYLLGIGVAAMRLSGNPVLGSLSFAFVWLIRSVPPLVQLLFWYELASLYPRLSLGIPFGSEFVTVRTAHLFSGILAAYVGLSLDVAAFSSEIVRGGILSVDHGQTEAAEALGLGERADLPPDRPAAGDAGHRAGLRQPADRHAEGDVDRERHRRAGPARTRSQLIYNQNYLIIPLLLVATLWYVILTTRAVDRAVLRRALLRPGQPTAGGGAELRRARSGTTCRSRPDRRRAWRGCRERRPPSPLVRIRGLRKSFGAQLGARRASTWTSARARSPCCSAPPARASPRCCAASTTWRRPDAGFVEVDGELIGYRYEDGTGCTSCAAPRDHPAARPDRHGLPAVQPVPAPDGAGEHHRGAGRRCTACPRKRGRGARPASCSTGSASAGQADGRIPRQLSGGQQQRVAIARALAMEPRLHALRRADQRARPRTGRRRPRRDAAISPTAG